jgi:uncharacterized membrane protein YgdD (TMEM256/DUF423 family)
VIWLRVGAVLGAIGVAAGAFGAHGLRDHVAPDLLAVFETGARYQMYHALALLAVGLLAVRQVPHPSRAITAAGALFTFGVVVFSGSLYLLALTGTRWLGAITPFGGVSLIAGWIALAVAASRPR